MDQKHTLLQQKMINGCFVQIYIYTHTHRLNQKQGSYAILFAQPSIVLANIINIQSHEQATQNVLYSGAHVLLKIFIPTVATLFNVNRVNFKLCLNY